MLRAIIHGKAGRVNFSGESVSWRYLFKYREDLLTAAIFTRWSYLSNKAKHTLIKNWIKDFELSIYKEIEFWSKYDLEAESREYVEPDVLIRFKDINILIEVKPPKGGGQYFKQWDRELKGYFSSDENLPLHFLAIGRNSIHADTWKKLLCEKYNQLESVNTVNWKVVAETIYTLTEESEPDSQDYKILLDMIEALKIYGVIAYPYKWTDFNKLFKSFRNINLSSISLFSDSKLISNKEVEREVIKPTFKDLIIKDPDIRLEVMRLWKRR